MNIQQSINEFINTHSGFEEHRSYLGMSRLSECPRKLYREFVSGTSADENTHRMAYAGYEQENNILLLLIQAGVAKPVQRELVASFDHRLRGHIDCETTEGDLLEIKSVSAAKWKRIVSENRPMYSHNMQVQSYLYFGGYKRGFIVYRNRDTYEHLVFEVTNNHKLQTQLEGKALRVLQAIDDGDLPICECGRCE